MGGEWGGGGIMQCYTFSFHKLQRKVARNWLRFVTT